MGCKGADFCNCDGSCLRRVTITPKERHPARQKFDELRWEMAKYFIPPAQLEECAQCKGKACSNVACPLRPPVMSRVG